MGGPQILRCSTKALFAICVLNTIGLCLNDACAHTEYISVNDPRPVAKALDLLRSRYGYVITYEDPRYAYVEDLRDVASEVRGDLSRFDLGKVPKVLVPAGGTLEMQYVDPSATAKPTSAVAIVQQVLDVQARRSNGGVFRLEQTGEILHVVPSQIRDGRGDWVEQTSILNVPITVEQTERDGMEMLRAICAAVSEATKETVVVGTVPINLLARNRAVQGASQERARDVLIRALRATQSRVSWQILYAPDLRWHVLNLDPVPDASPRSDTSATREEMRRPSGKSPAQPPDS